MKKKIDINLSLGHFFFLVKRLGGFHFDDV